MPRRITTNHPPTPQSESDTSTDVSTCDLETQVRQVLAVWATSCEHSEQTRIRMSETIQRFGAWAAACGVGSLSVVSEGDARGFITAPTRHAAEPELATQHARRTALRTLYRTARSLDLAQGDPTLDVVLPPRGCLAARPLSDDEVTLCRASARARRGPGASLRATAWALGEASAISSEITRIRISDLDDPDHPRYVQLPGTRRHDPREAVLTAWGSLILGERASTLLALHGPEALLAYGGHAPPGGAKAQASVCNALRHVLGSAGLLRETDIRPASLRHWAGRSAYDTGTPLETVARQLGLRSLDATAEDIALDWRHDGAGTPDTAHRGVPENTSCPTSPHASSHPHRHLTALTLQEDLK